VTKDEYNALPENLACVIASDPKGYLKKAGI